MRNLMSTIVLAIGLLVAGGASAEYTTDVENELVTICKVIKERNLSLLSKEVNDLHLRYLTGVIEYQDVVASLTCKSISALEYALELDSIASAQILADMININLNEYIAWLKSELKVGS